VRLFCASWPSNETQEQKRKEDWGLTAVYLREARVCSSSASPVMDSLHQCPQRVLGVHKRNHLIPSLSRECSNWTHGGNWAECLDMVQRRWWHILLEEEAAWQRAKGVGSGPVFEGQWSVMGLGCRKVAPESTDPRPRLCQWKSQHWHPLVKNKDVELANVRDFAYIILFFVFQCHSCLSREYIWMS
jgi:hypothetical protein